MSMISKRPVKLIQRLKELDVTNKTFAEVAGVSERAVYHWFSYNKEPELTPLQVARMCDLLKWSAQELADAYYPDEDIFDKPTEPKLTLLQFASLCDLLKWSAQDFVKAFYSGESVSHDSSEAGD